MMRSAGCLFLKLAIGTLLVLMGGPAWSQTNTPPTVTLTTVQGPVYLASGALATGVATVSWPGFTGPGNQVVAAGSVTTSIGASGMLSVSLAPNLGAVPAGSYYTVVYHLGDGTVNTEYWTVPPTGTMTLDGVRQELQPSPAIVQSVSKGYVDSLFESMTSLAGNFLPVGGGTLAGPLQLGSDPITSMQASTKHYVDQQVATAVPLTGGVVLGTLGMANQVAQLPRIDVRSTNFAGGADPTGTRDSLPAIQAAVAFAKANASSPSDATFPSIYFPPGRYLVNGTISLQSNMHLVGDSKANTILEETGASSNLITVYNAGCSVYVCYGGIENLTLEGMGKATTGTLLEMNSGFFTLRDVHFFNSAGRGLQMNGASERMVSYDSSFYDVRWPLVMAGDTNEDYFYNTHVIEAGQTKDNSGSPTWFSNWCYSVNCTNGVFNGPGTTGNPTLLYPDPHGSIHIDKAVNVSFIGGSIKSTGVLSGVRIWNGDMVKFENMYHEDEYGGSIPRINRAYILGGKAEQTYFTGTLAGNGSSVAVHDSSWMPQYYGNPLDAVASSSDFYPYVILPQDYNRASTALSAFVPGLQQNQFEVVDIEGFASDGNLYIARRSIGGSTAAAGTQWPAGSIIEQYAGSGFAGQVELNNIHLNQVQGPTAVGGYQAACNQATAWSCGEIVAGYAPDTENLTANPATNRVEFYTPIGDPNDPIWSSSVGFSMRSMDMFSSGSNPYVGQIATHHRVNIQIYGSVNAEALEGLEAVNANANGKQISIAASTGGSYVTAPMYPSTGQPAAVQVSLPDADTLWDSARNFYTKKASVFGMYQQYGSYMNGMQFENLYCLFDTPTTDGGRSNNRFCAGGGPSNNAGSGAGFGGGIEYDSWNGISWMPLFKVAGQNGSGTITAGGPATFASTVSINGGAAIAGALTAAANATVAGALNAGAANIGGALSAATANITGTMTAGGVAANGPISSSRLTFNPSGNSLSNVPVMVWSPWGSCAAINAGCSESGAPLNLLYPVTIKGWTLSLMTAPLGCTAAGAVSLLNGSTVLSTINLTNGTSTYSATIGTGTVASSSALQIEVSSPANGCTIYGNNFNSNVTYTMQ